MPFHLRALSLLLMLAPLPVAAQDGGAAALPAPKGATQLKEVQGRVSAVDRAHHLVTVETPTGPIALEVSRDTTVYVPGRVGTVLSVEPGADVRGAYEATGEVHRAAWLEVTRFASGDAGVAPPATALPPAGGGAPDAGSADGGAADAGAPAKAPDAGPGDGGASGSPARAP